MHIVEDPCGHMVIKRIIKGEAEVTSHDKEKGIGGKLEIPTDILDLFFTSSFILLHCQ